MLYSLISVFAPMLLGAQIILTLVLRKGEICPGQRGRIHKVLPALGVLWLAVASIKIEAFLVVFALFYFYSQVQTKKTREEGPLWVLYLANGLALAYVGILMIEVPAWPASITLFAMIFLLGGIFGHLLLTLARSRLQAFHRILPVVGIFSAMLIALSILPYISGLSDAQIHTLVTPLVISVGLLITGIVIWCWHLFSGKTVNKWQLVAAGSALLASATGFHGLYITAL